jgi:beta-phosphoglucomutase-like phosphatase (HAD superfamily)
MLDAVLLDWENVLADTGSARHEALLRALREEGVPVSSHFGNDSHEWSGLEAAARAAVHGSGIADETVVALVVARAARAFAERLGKGFVLRPGAYELVAHVQSASRLMIVSTATRSETEFMLRLAGLEGAASAVVSADDALDPPPSPVAYRHAVEKLSRRTPVHLARTLAIVATLPSLRAARDAGLRTLALDMPAHAAVEADGALANLVGITIGELTRAAGIAPVERRS